MATSPLPAWTTHSKHVRLCVLHRVKLAPLSNSNLTIFTRPCRHAICKAVSPSMFALSKHDAFASSSWHDFSNPSLDAHINGVHPLLSVQPASAPSLNKVKQTFLKYNALWWVFFFQMKWTKFQLQVMRNLNSQGRGKRWNGLNYCRFYPKMFLRYFCKQSRRVLTLTYWFAAFSYPKAPFFSI